MSFSETQPAVTCWGVQQVRACARACACVSVRRVLTAQGNDVAAVFVDKLLRHRLLHDLLHLQHTQKGEESRRGTNAAFHPVSDVADGY